MKVKDNLLTIFNRYGVEDDELSQSVAKGFKFKYSKKEKKWISLPREIMGESVSKLFQKFMDEYKKNYRFQNAVKAFYQLTDEDIEDMFDELPFYLKSFQGHEIYKPNAATFLSDKLWKEDYPRKIQRDRSKKVSVTGARNWDEYIAMLPEEQRSAAEAYKDIISFESFKTLINGAGKKG
jgi:type I site-specific restriction-modification system R (restriction) subunit